MFAEAETQMCNKTLESGHVTRLSTWKGGASSSVMQNEMSNKTSQNLSTRLTTDLASCIYH